VAGEPMRKIVKTLRALDHQVANARKSAVLSELLKLIARHKHAIADRAIEALLQVGQMFGEPMLRLNHQLGGDEKHKRAQIGNKINDNKVNLMTDGENDEQSRRDNHASQAFVVEESQILNGAASTR